jgi:hypothetical protein
LRRQEIQTQKKLQISLKLPMAEITSVHDAGFPRASNRLIQNTRHDIYVTSFSKPTRRTRPYLNPTRHQKGPLNTLVFEAKY